MLRRPFLCGPMEGRARRPELHSADGGRADFSVGLFDQAKIDRVIGTCLATLALWRAPRHRSYGTAANSQQFAVISLRAPAPPGPRAPGPAAAPASLARPRPAGPGHSRGRPRARGAPPR